MGAFSKYGDYESMAFTLPVGAAAPLTFTFKRPYAFRVISLDQSCAACNATDKVTVSFVVGTTTIMTGAPNTTVKTIISNTAPDAGQTLEVAADALCHVTLVYAGTAASVNGICIVLTIQPTR
jgi:hypothetical protein